MAKQILVVDDDSTARGFIERYLRKQGYDVSAVVDGEGMRRFLSSRKADLVILDLMLPGEDGLDLARHIRETSDIPIIMVTARGDTVDRIVGLEVGADDYLSKPFDPRELLARIKSVLRRAATRGDQSGASYRSDKGDRTVAGFAGWRLDLDSRQLHSPGGESIHLSAREFELISVFVEYPGRVLSREKLIDLTRGHGVHPFDRSIDVQVLRLRRKIEENPSSPKLIRTEQGVGYIFTPPVVWS